MLDLCHWYLLSTRVMLTQHSAALAALQAANSSSSSPTKPDAVMHYHEPGHKSTNPQQVYTPPHQQLAGSAATAVSLVRRQARVLDMVKLVAEDCRWGRRNYQREWIDACPCSYTWVQSPCRVAWFCLLCSRGSSEVLLVTRQVVQEAFWGQPQQAFDHTVSQQLDLLPLRTLNYTRLAQ
jgi:hypothetical protein